MGKTLINPDGIAMEEVVGSFTEMKLGVTFCCGTKPIDGFWAKTDLVVTGACVMSAGYGFGYHQLFVV